MAQQRSWTRPGPASRSTVLRRLRLRTNRCAGTRTTTSGANSPKKKATFRFRKPFLK